MGKRKTAFKDWLIKKGIEDLIKVLNLTLIETCNYGVLYLSMNSIKTVKDYNTILENERKSTRKLGIPQLIERIEGFLTDQLLHKEKILSINKLRYCLAHRNGTITGVDINDKEKEILKLEYSGFKLVRYEDGQEIEIDGPFETNETDVSVSFVEKKRNFKIGETINFTYREFNEINLTFSLFGHDLTNKLPR